MKVKKIIGRILCLLLILLFCSFLRSCGRYHGTFGSVELWFEEKSPDNLYSIVCKKILGAPPYSKNRIDIEIKMIDGISVLYGESLINNNGKKLNNSNYEIDWITKGAILTFKGLGQDPISYVIEWDKTFLDNEKEVEHWKALNE